MKAVAVEDLRLHKKLMELHGVPAAADAFGEVRGVLAAKNDYESRVWRFPGDGSEAKPFTHGPGNDASPRLSPDGATLAFLSDRAGSMQIHVMSLAGGEARQVGAFAQGVSDFAGAPDGKTIFVAAAGAVDPDARGAGKPAPEGPRDDRVPEVCWKLPYKSDGVGYLLAREIHLPRWMWPVARRLS